MRALLQRVTWGNVAVAGSEIGAIGPGLVVLLGVRKGDGEAQALALAKKITGLRVFEDEQGKMNLDLKQIKGEVLVISQFTLYADTRKGRRPAFTDAEDPAPAKALYEKFCDFLRQEGLQVETGQFAAHMRVSLQNDGPVTIMLDTDET